ncbi:MAG: cytochrome c3 family protein [bacterium]|nr:MAG: cytochrome c3 family protein [bacterium]
MLSICHEPVREGECSDCHTNHSGEAPFTNASFDGRMYVPFRPEAYDLCFQCHSLTLVQEDYTETATRFRHKRWNLHTHHVVRDGERGFSCWVCHDVHASRQPHLINAEVQYNPVYRLRIDYRALEGGGQCQTTCHKAQDYTR